MIPGESEEEEDIRDRECGERGERLARRKSRRKSRKTLRKSEVSCGGDEVWKPRKSTAFERRKSRVSQERCASQTAMR